MRTRAFLASLVPVILNSVLNEHQLVLDIVAFVAFGDFPRSRLGEKQRGKILASWVSRKMRTIAQFSIRDPDAEGSVGTIGPEDMMNRRGSGQSGRAGTTGSIRQGGGGSALRHMESLTNLPVTEEPDQQYDPSQLNVDPTRPSVPDRSTSRNDATPTNENPHPFDLNTTVDYSPVEPLAYDSPEMLARQPPPGSAAYAMQASYGAPDPYDPYHDYDGGPQELPGSTGGLRVSY